MSFDPKVPIEVSLCKCVQRDENAPHWMLMLASEGSGKGTWYHSKGGPTQHKDYELAIEANKRVNSQGIASRELLGRISPADVNKVKAAAQRIRPQQCQTYVVSLIADLENRQLLPAGNAARLNDDVQMGKAAREYLQTHPVPPPAIPSAGPSTPPRRESPPRQSPPRQSPPRQSPPRQSPPRQSPPRRSPPR